MDKPAKRRVAHVEARQLLTAVSAVHSLGYLHRDVKPKNVLLGQDGLRGPVTFACKNRRSTGRSSGLNWQTSGVPAPPRPRMPTWPQPLPACSHSVYVSAGCASLACSQLFRSLSTARQYRGIMLQTVWFSGSAAFSLLFQGISTARQHPDEGTILQAPG